MKMNQKARMSMFVMLGFVPWRLNCLLSQVVQPKPLYASASFLITVNKLAV
jgi:hypothetical protein